MLAEPTVYLVGAGPGDPDLLTLKAHRLLQKADVVVYDRLVGEKILKLVPRGAMLISVGKAPRQHPIPQKEINLMLVSLAKAGRTVVRLKGGDPFVFGRGSEEAEELADQGVRFEVVPGITAASGCGAALGIPLTHRGTATGVRFVTGHCREDRELDLNWASLADPDTTLVVYMGMANIEQIADRLIEHGLPPETPVAAINEGTTDKQRSVVAPLTGIAETARRAAFGGPVLFVIGRVVDMAISLGGLSGPVDQRDAEPVSVG